MASDELWEMGEIIGKRSNAYYFSFEHVFAPYMKFMRNSEIEKIDLVIYENDEPIIPYEIKLTVVPDSATLSLSEEFWAPEIVMRPVSSAHAMLGVASRLVDLQGAKKDAILILKSTYDRISSWSNKQEILTNSDQLIKTLDDVISLLEPYQSPFLIQPIWKTQGQSFVLSENCFDVFVWSDLSILKLPILQTQASGKVFDRSMREIARHVKALYEILKMGDFNYTETYKNVGLNMLTDRAFSISGNQSLKYMKHHRLKRPKLSKKVLPKLVLEGGEMQLKPERRFDAAVQAFMCT